VKEKIHGTLKIHLDTWTKTACFSFHSKMDIYNMIQNITCGVAETTQTFWGNLSFKLIL